MRYAGTLKNGSVTSHLWITNLSFSLNAGSSPVLAQNSVYFTAPKPSMSNIQFQITQPSINAQNATVGLLQRWAQNNDVLTLAIPEININYLGSIQQASYTWAYNQPIPALDVSFACITNLLYTGESGFNVDPDLWQYFTQSVVTKNINQLLNAVKPLNANTQALNAEQQKAANTAAVASWLKQKVQFNGYQIVYNKNGTVSIRQGNFWEKDLTPTPKLLYQLEHGTFRIGAYAKRVRGVRIASAH